jgi:hypothetical protein
MYLLFKTSFIIKDGVEISGEIKVSVREILFIIISIIDRSFLYSVDERGTF